MRVRLEDSDRHLFEIDATERAITYCLAFVRPAYELGVAICTGAAHSRATIHTMFETIIVPLDGSELAEAALTPALELRERFGAHLLLLRSIESEAERLTEAAVFGEAAVSAAVNVDVVDRMIEAERGEATAYLEAVKKRLGAAVAAESEVRAGPAVEAIISLAAEREGALIVMSSHGRGGLGRLVFGSVADAVLRESHLPVLLIRPQAAGA